MRLVPATKNGPKRRPARSHRRRPIAAEQLESRAMLAGLSIDGGLSWNGWTRRGLSDQGDLYGSGGVTNAELYEVYTTTFAFDASTNTINDSAVRAVAPAPDGFAAGRIAPTPAGPFAVSKGAFADGNTILGIGVRVQGAGSIVGFKPTLRFDLDNDSYASASKAGRPVGRTSFTSFSEQGDFTVQFEGGSSWRGSTISVQAGPRSNEGTPDKTTYTGTNDTVLLPGGVGSGTSYDFAFRAFAQPAANAYQMFIDMTAIPKLYGSADPASVYKLFFPNKAGVGTIGDRVTVSLNGLGSNNVVFDANLTLPPVDLDVDSDNADTVPDPANDPVDRSAAEEAIEADSTMPGVIVPVGGNRAKMVVDVPAGRTATLAFDPTAAAKVKVFAASGAVVLEQGRLSTRIVGGSPQTFWIEAFAPSESMADIAFTLTPTGGSPASADTIRATAVAADLVAHRTGGRLGDVTPENLESAGDPNTYMILTNRDFEQGLPLAGRDFDDGVALLPPFIGPEGRADDDLAKITLKRLPSGLNAGSVRLSVSHPDAVRLFKPIPGSMYGTVLAPGEWTAALASDGYLAGLKSRDVDIWLEGLSMVKDFVFTVEYVAPSGSVLASDDVHMLIADWTFRGSDGYEVPFVSPVWLDALLAATDSPKKPLADPTGAFYKIHIDGLAPRLVTQLLVASDSTPDFYTESYVGGDFDTAYSSATVSSRFGVLHSAAHVLYAPEDPLVTPAQRQLIRDTLDLNVVHNDGLKATVVTPWDTQSDYLRKHGRFHWSLQEKGTSVYAVGATIKGTIEWPERFFPKPDLFQRPIILFATTDEPNPQFTPLKWSHDGQRLDFEFAARREGYLRIVFCEKPNEGIVVPIPYWQLSSILVRITADGTLPEWEAQAWDALKVDGFVPGDPINRNRQITTQYANMFNEGKKPNQLNPFEWFGLAAFASRLVGDGLHTAMRDGWAPLPDKPPSNNVPPSPQKVFAGLAEGNLEIFIDMYKAGLAYSSKDKLAAILNSNEFNDLQKGSIRDLHG